MGNQCCSSDKNVEAMDMRGPKVEKKGKKAQSKPITMYEVSQPTSAKEEVKEQAQKPPIVSQETIDPSPDPSGSRTLGRDVAAAQLAEEIGQSQNDCTSQMISQKSQINSVIQPEQNVNVNNEQVYFEVDASYDGPPLGGPGPQLDQNSESSNKGMNTDRARESGPELVLETDPKLAPRPHSQVPSPRMEETKEAEKNEEIIIIEDNQHTNEHLQYNTIKAADVVEMQPIEQHLNFDKLEKEEKNRMLGNVVGIMQIEVAEVEEPKQSELPKDEIKTVEEEITPQEETKPEAETQPEEETKLPAGRKSIYDDGHEELQKSDKMVDEVLSSKNLIQESSPLPQPGLHDGELATEDLRLPTNLEDLDQAAKDLVEKQKEEEGLLTDRVLTPIEETESLYSSQAKGTPAITPRVGGGPNPESLMAKLDAKRELSTSKNDNQQARIFVFDPSEDQSDLVSGEDGQPTGHVDIGNQNLEVDAFNPFISPRMGGQQAQIEEALIKESPSFNLPESGDQPCRKFQLNDIQLRPIDLDDDTSREISLEMINTIIDQVILEINTPKKREHPVQSRFVQLKAKATAERKKEEEKAKAEAMEDDADDDFAEEIRLGALQLSNSDDAGPFEVTFGTEQLRNGKQEDEDQEYEEFLKQAEEIFQKPKVETFSPEKDVYTKVLEGQNMNSPLIKINQNLIKGPMSQPKKSRSKQLKKKGKGKNFFDSNEPNGQNGENGETTNFEQDTKSETSFKRITEVENAYLTVGKDGDGTALGPLSCTSPRSSRSFVHGFSTTISTRPNETNDNSDGRSVVLGLDSSRKEEADEKGQVSIVVKKKGRKSQLGRRSVLTSKSKNSASGSQIDATAMNAAMSSAIKKQLDARLQKEILSNWDF